MTLVPGNVFNIFANFCRIPSPTSSDRANLKLDIAMAALELLVLVTGSLALNSLTSFLDFNRRTKFLGAGGPRAKVGEVGCFLPWEATF